MTLLEEIGIDPFSVPYIGDIACAQCKFVMRGSVSYNGTIIEPKYLSLESISHVWDKLSEVEQKSLIEASRSFGVDSYTASELIALRTLESILRRIYGVKLTLGNLIKKMEKDNDLNGMAGILVYFKDVRNRLAHPEKISTKSEAESTFGMTKRLLEEFIDKKNL